MHHLPASYAICIALATWRAGLPAEITCVRERLHATILEHLTSALHSLLVSSVSSAISSISAV
jgi:hypothetical protein